MKIRGLIAELIFAGIASMNFLVPKREQVVMHSFPDIEDQLVAILRWLGAQGKRKLSVVFLSSESPRLVKANLEMLIGDYVSRIKVFRKDSLRGVWAYWRSRVVLFTHGLYGFYPVPSNQCVVNLWHGMPIKAIWKSARNSRVPQCTHLLSTSQMYVEILARSSGLSSKMIKVTGLPRNDLLFNATDRVTELERDLRADADFLVINLPTYRQSERGYKTSDGDEMGSALCMTDEEVDKLKDVLEKCRIRMLVKPHPMSVHYGKTLKVSNYLWVISNEWLCERGVVLYDLLGRADCLVTDASSVYIDFLCTRRLALCYFPDIDSYRVSRKFLLEPLEEWVVGDVIRTGEGLATALQRGLVESERDCNNLDGKLQLLNEQVIPDSCDRVMELCGLR